MPPSDHLPRDSEKTVAPDASDQGRIVGNDRQARGVEQIVLDEYRLAHSKSRTLN